MLYTKRARPRVRAIIRDCVFPDAGREIVQDRRKRLWRPCTFFFNRTCGTLLWPHTRRLAWPLAFSTKDHNQDTLHKLEQFDSNIRLNLFYDLAAQNL